MDTNQNYVSEGDSITMPAPSASVTNGLKAGSFYLIGSLFMMSNHTTTVDEAGKLVSFQRVGNFKLPKKVGETHTVGQRLFWDNTNRTVTNVPVPGLFEVAICTESQDDTNSALTTGLLIGYATEVTATIIPTLMAGEGETKS